MSNGERALPDLRPLRMGELIDRSATLWRRHAWPLFRLTFGFSLALYAMSKALLLALGRWAPAFLGGQGLATALTGDLTTVVQQLPTVGVLFLVFALGYAWVNWHCWVATSDYAVGAWLGREVSVQQSLRRALSQAWASSTSFVVAALYAVASITVFMIPGAAVIAGATLISNGSLAAVLAIVGGILAMAGFIVGILWCVLRFLLTCQVLATEDAGGVQAIRRSGALIAGRIGPGLLGWVKVRATVMVTVVAAVIFAVLSVSGLPALILQAVYGNLLDPGHANPNAVPDTLLVPAELLQVFVEALVSPLYIAFAGLFYVDMRVRREGLDLELALRREAA